jgi:hypothetical protein
MQMGCIAYSSEVNRYAEYLGTAPTEESLGKLGN